jgi:hypothetical protein
MNRSPYVLALSLSVFLARPGPVSGQAPTKPATPAKDGQLRSELALMGRTVTVAYRPDLRADDSTHRALQADSPSADARVRVAGLIATGPVLVGGLEIGKPAGRPDPTGMRYDVWLQGKGDGWQIELTDAPKDPALAPTVVGQVPLARTVAAAAVPALVAALLPENGDAGRLLLRWGRFEASADLKFPVLPIPDLTAGDRPNVPTNRAHDEDLSIALRFIMLSQRSESALVPPSGRRASVQFQRTFVSGERLGNAAGTRTSPGLPTSGPDFARLMSTPVGGVVQLTRASVPRFKNEGPIRFGKTVVATGNQVPGTPGLYGIWLKRVSKGWRLVFNHEPDVWGTQYDPKHDAAEMELTHSETGAPSRPFAVALVPTAADRGRLVILWGPHEWSTEYVAAN